MEIKKLEIRDKATFIPALAIEISGADGWLARAAGYGGRCIALTCLRFREETITYDPFGWGDRTRHTAHLYIRDHWDEIKDGDVIDVELILGETKEKKASCKSEYVKFDAEGE